MIITLDANPHDAPCCVKIVADDGRNVLVQTDWDYPSVAGSFGFSLRSVQMCQGCRKPKAVQNGANGFACHPCRDLVGKCCDHDFTDGTMICDGCGLCPSDFISAARQWLDDHDGATAEDPGYFDNN